MIGKIIRWWRERAARRRSMRRLLLQKDDRMLRDIGLTRDDLHQLLDQWEES
ncbi:MAG: DUF1127 domain-containing protein [Pseudorhodobacter sp.]